MASFSVVVRTINRPTLIAAIESSLREGFHTIVVSDGVPLPPLPRHDNLDVYKLGKRFGYKNGVMYYGQIALTVGVYMSPADYVGSLDDDDVFIEGAGELIRSTIESKPTVDIWVPGIQRLGMLHCADAGRFEVGNLGTPFYRASIFETLPMFHHEGEDHHISDYLHIERCVKAGFSVDWISKACVDIRPGLPTGRGYGQ